MREESNCDLKRLALQQGPEQYLALDELACRLREDQANWWTPGEHWIWNPLDITRAPNAVEVEWALLKLSQLYNDRTGGQGTDYELVGTQDHRLADIEAQLDQVQDSLEIRFFNCLQACIRESGTYDGTVASPYSA